MATHKLSILVEAIGTAKAAKNLQGIDRTISNIGAKGGQGIRTAASNLAKLGLVAGTVAIGGLAAAARAAIDFEDAFASVRKTVDEADLTKVGLTFRDLELEFRKMATQIPISASEFARLGETAGALGIRAQDITEFSRVTALLGVTTDLTADQAADALGRIGTILQFTGKDYERFADTLVNLGNKGASVESEIIEITKRFAIEGKTAGLAVDQIAALASATASLGFAPERGGTALARVFGNMAKGISLDDKHGRAFGLVASGLFDDLERAKATKNAKAVRKITDELDAAMLKFQRRVDKGEGMTTFLEFLEGLRDLSPTEAARALARAGIGNVSDRTLFRTMAENLPFINDQLKIAASSTGALSEEATKRFGTIRSKLQVLKNNLIEAGIAVGEKMLPAIGRFADRLIEMLQDPKFGKSLQKLGADIGLLIDRLTRKIDWQGLAKDARALTAGLGGGLSRAADLATKIPWGAVGDGLKVAAEWAGKLFDVFASLPKDVQTTLIAFAGLNKLTGGAVGGIVSELGKGLIKGVLGLNAGVVNVNAGVVNGGGAGVAAAGLTGLGKLASLSIIATSVVLWADSLVDAAEKNDQMKQQGLTPAEIEAVKYYQGDTAYQQQMFKRLGRTPDRADYERGMAKLEGASKEERAEARKDAAAAGILLTRGFHQVADTIRTERAVTAEDIRNGFRLVKPPVVNLNIQTGVTISMVQERIKKQTSYGKFSGSYAGGPGGPLLVLDGF